MPPAKKKPLTSAERARNYRARKAAEAEEAAAKEAAERDAAAKSASVTKPAGPIRMRTSVAEAIKHMKWLKPTDYALRDQAMLIAGLIDDLFDDDPLANTGRMASLGQLLTRLLRDLGGAPTVRLQHELRSLRLLSAGGEGGGEGGDEKQERAGDQKPSEEQAGVAAVIPIRPPKRRA